MTYITLTESSSAGTLNIIDNGGFEIWQRGTTFTNPVNAVYTADRWRTFGGPSSTWTISQETSIIASGGSQSKAIKIVVTATTEPILGMLYYIENWTDYVGKTITVSAQVRSTVAGKISIIINDGQQANGAYNTLTNTYETLTVSKKIVDIGQNRIYIAIGQVDSVVTPVPLTYYIDNVMCTIGSQAVTFVPTNPEIDLARCQRYYYRITGPAFVGVGQAASSSQVGVNLQYPVTMRTTPTLSFTGIANITGADSTGGAHAFTSLTNLGFSNEKSYSLSCTGAAGLVAGNASWVAIQNSSGFIEFSADI